MPLFTNHLRKESDLIQKGLELLQAYRSDLENGKEVLLADLRVAIFAMQKVLEHSHIAKEESILYPALLKSEKWSSTSEMAKSNIHSVFNLHAVVRDRLLALRIAIDECECEPELKGLVDLRLAEFVDQSVTYLGCEKDLLYEISENILGLTVQKNLFVLSQDFESLYGINHLQGPRFIFNHLRKAKGMTAA